MYGSINSLPLATIKKIKFMDIYGYLWHIQWLPLRLHTLAAPSGMFTQLSNYKSFKLATDGQHSRCIHVSSRERTEFQMGPLQIMIHLHAETVTTKSNKCSKVVALKTLPNVQLRWVNRLTKLKKCYMILLLAM